MAKLKQSAAPSGTRVSTRKDGKTKNNAQKIKTVIQKEPKKVAKKMDIVAFTAKKQKTLINAIRPCVVKLPRINLIVTPPVIPSVTVSTDQTIPTQRRTVLRVSPLKYATRNKQNKKAAKELKNFKSKLRKCVVKVKRINLATWSGVPAAVAPQMPPAIESAETRTKSMLKANTHRANEEVSGNSKTYPIVRLRRIARTFATSATKSQMNLKCTNADSSNAISKDFVLTPAMRNGLNKLSLRRSVVRSGAEPQTQMLEISSFEPMRNSTVFDFEQRPNADFLKSPQNEKEVTTGATVSTTVDENRTTPPKSYLKTCNLANKRDFIEQLLLSEDEESIVASAAVMDTSKHVQFESSRQLSASAAKPIHKFFHTRDQVAVDCNANQPSITSMKKPLAPPQSKKVKKRLSTKRCKSKTSVYEYLSQSQTSDSDNGKKVDPAADIIRKLIQEGKVSVATRGKGTGRPRMKRLGKPTKKSASAKPRAAVHIKRQHENIQSGSGSLTIENDARMLSPSPVDGWSDTHYEDIDHVEAPHIVPSHVEPTPTSNLCETNAADATFSRLARSVLINEAAKNDHKHERVYDKRQLLEVAQKFVNAPTKNKHAPQRNTNLSPISALRKEQQCGSASPWRVAEDTHLPTVFHFNTGAFNLPTYSSEFIPPTPRKQAKTMKSIVEEDCMPASLAAENAAVPATDAPATTSISSSSFNDSNAENMPPPRPVSAAADNDVDPRDANADIFNMRQLPNPRRTLKNRSPLKNINIIEVVTLPPWTVAADKSSEKVSKPNNSDNSVTKEPKEQHKDDLFGFEDFLVSESDSQDANNESIAQSPTPDPHECLREKLHRLNKWRPAVATDRPRATTPMPKVFDEAGSTAPRRSIKEMLCSTMIKPAALPSKQRELAAAVALIFADDEDAPAQESNTQNANELDMFNDTHRQLSSNAQASHRTYERSFKRSRKRRRYFNLFKDSDESDAETSNDEDCVLDRNEPHIRKQQKKKRQKHEPQQESAELESYVKKFNAECQEVEDYEPVVE